jgi:hypothetical protein
VQERKAEGRKSWDMGLDYDRTYRQILGRLEELRGRRTITARRKLAYACVLLTQLRIGSRVSEAVDAVVEWCSTRRREVDVTVRKQRKRLDDCVYEELTVEQEILEKMSPTMIKEKYLRDKEFARVYSIYNSMLKTQGERRLVSRGSLEESILQGVKQGLFGLGELRDGRGSVDCRYFKMDGIVTFEENEVIIKDTICTEQEKGPLALPVASSMLPPPAVLEGSPQPPTSRPTALEREDISLEFDVPKGKVSQIMGMMNFIQRKFEELRITIKATKGSVSDEEYEMKMRETLRQLGIEMDEK